MEDAFDSRRILYRSWMGFMLLFRGESIALDSNLVPILRVNDTKKGSAMMHSMRDVVRSTDCRMYPLFFVGVGIHSLGKIPHPFDPIDEKASKRMRDLCDRNLHVLCGLEDECRKLWKKRISKRDIIELVTLNEISVQAAACYIKKFEPIDVYGKQNSLRMSRIEDIVDIATNLEIKYDFFKKYRKLAISVFKNEAEMTK